MNSSTPGSAIPLIREIQPRDLALILNLTQIIPEAPAWGIEDFRKLVSKDHSAGDLALTRMAWVAERNARVLGMVVVQRLFIAGDEPDAAECELESILVDPASRRTGLGQQLLSHAIEWCNQQHACRLRLEVRASNHAAIRLYEKNGFAASGKRPCYYAHPEEDALLMQRIF